MTNVRVTSLPVPTRAGVCNGLRVITLPGVANGWMTLRCGMNPDHAGKSHRMELAPGVLVLFVDEPKPVDDASGSSPASV